MRSATPPGRILCSSVSSSFGRSTADPADGALHRAPPAPLAVLWGQLGGRECTARAGGGGREGRGAVMHARPPVGQGARRCEAIQPDH